MIEKSQEEQLANKAATRRNNYIFGLVGAGMLASLTLSFSSMYRYSHEKDLVPSKSVVTYLDLEQKIINLRQDQLRVQYPLEQTANSITRLQFGSLNSQDQRLNKSLENLSKDLANASRLIGEEYETSVKKIDLQLKPLETNSEVMAYRAQYKKREEELVVHSGYSLVGVFGSIGLGLIAIMGNAIYSSLKIKKLKKNQ